MHKEASTCRGVFVSTLFLARVLGSKTTTEIKSPKTSGTMCISERKINTWKEAVFFPACNHSFFCSKRKEQSVGDGL